MLSEVMGTLTRETVMDDGRGHEATYPVGTLVLAIPQSESDGAGGRYIVRPPGTVFSAIVSRNAFKPVEKLCVVWSEALRRYVLPEPPEKTVIKL